jgi:hypothetical protein
MRRAIRRGEATALREDVGSYAPRVCVGGGPSRNGEVATACRAIGVGDPRFASSRINAVVLVGAVRQLSSPVTRGDVVAS